MARVSATPSLTRAGPLPYRAVILAVGSELLTPSRIDTNSLFITEQLNLFGDRGCVQECGR